MASSTTTPGEVEGGAVGQQQQQGTSQVGAAAAAPVELNDLSARQHAQSSAQDQSLSTSIVEKPAAQPQADNQIQSSATQTSLAEDTPLPVTRKETEAIGPATDAPTMQLDPSAGPAIMITLLLPTGARHPFKIDEKYLKRRNITVEDMNPLNISVYNMKELIWRDWREEWEPRPTSPTYIRLIFFGSMLDDKSPLKECKFNTETPNVVHMTVKPQEIVEDEDVKQSGKHNRRGSDGERGSFRCCIVL